MMLLDTQSRTWQVKVSVPLGTRPRFSRSSSVLLGTQSRTFQVKVSVLTPDTLGTPGYSIPDVAGGSLGSPRCSRVLSPGPCNWRFRYSSVLLDSQSWTLQVKVSVLPGTRPRFSRYFSVLLGTQSRTLQVEVSVLVDASGYSVPDQAGEGLGSPRSSWVLNPGPSR